MNINSLKSIVIHKMTMKYSNIIISVRFPKKDAILLKDIANDRGQNVSNFVRMSVRRELGRLNFLSSKEKKALEILDVKK